MIAEVCGGNLQAHSGSEFGDLSFLTRIEGRQYTGVCLVKSYQEKGQFTPANDGGLLHQIFQAANIELMEFVAIVSGNDLHPGLKAFIRQIMGYKKKKFVFVERNQLLRIAKEYLERHTISSNRLEYAFDDIPKFQKMVESKDIDQNTEKNLEEFVNNIREKCSEYGSKACERCMRDNPELCIQKMIAAFIGGDFGLYPRLGCGYFSFKTEIEKDKPHRTVTCLIKSYQSKGPKTRFTIKNNGGLLPYTIWAANTGKTDIVGIVSGKDLESGLKSYLEMIMRYGGKRFFFIGRKELFRISETYRRNIGELLLPEITKRIGGDIHG